MYPLYRGVGNPAAKFGVVTLFADSQRALLSASLENKQSYCRRHGCALYVPNALASTDSAREHKRPHYTKILAVEHVLSSFGHEWVMWTDADAIFFNTSASPEDVLQESFRVGIAGAHTQTGPAPGIPFPIDAGPIRVPSEVDFVLTWPLNTGCFFVRNSPSAMATLKKWFRYDLDGSRKVEKRWNDQGAFIDMLSTDAAIRSSIAYVNYETDPLAAEWPWYGTHSYQVHLPGRPLNDKVTILKRLDLERKAIESFYRNL